MQVQKYALMQVRVNTLKQVRLKTLLQVHVNIDRAHNFFWRWGSVLNQNHHMNKKYVVAVVTAGYIW